MSVVGDYNTVIPLDPPVITIDLITNEFLIYGRARRSGCNVGCGCGQCNGESESGLGNRNVCTYDGKGIPILRPSRILTDTSNPFLVYGRARKNGCNIGCGCGDCDGDGNDVSHGGGSGLGNQNVCSFSGFTQLETTLDYKVDILDNALGFRITDDGRIGYRLISFTGQCSGETYVSGLTVNEGYSASGMVSNNVWTNVVVRFVSNEYLDDCELKYRDPRKGRLMFYINGKLKFIVEDFSEFVAKRLNEYKAKQAAVPFNFSLGGGSQGLIESQTFDGVDQSDRNLPIQENFAGTFIGDISQFKFNTCDVPWVDIQNNYYAERLRYI